MQPFTSQQPLGQITSVLHDLRDELARLAYQPTTQHRTLNAIKSLLFRWPSPVGYPARRQCVAVLSPSGEARCGMWMAKSQTQTVASESSSGAEAGLNVSLTKSSSFRPALIDCDNGLGASEFIAPPVFLGRDSGSSRQCACGKQLILPV